MSLKLINFEKKTRNIRKQLIREHLKMLQYAKKLGWKLFVINTCASDLLNIPEEFDVDKITIHKTVYKKYIVECGDWVIPVSNIENITIGELEDKCLEVVTAGIWRNEKTIQ